MEEKHREQGMLRARVEALSERLAGLAKDPAAPPALLAVTKTIPRERVDALPMDLLCGVGENRVQEITEKFAMDLPAYPIHFIGRLQTNKVKYIIDKVCMVQSLDREELAQEIDRRAQRSGLCMPVLLQVNIGAEPQKGGIPPEEVPAFARRCAAMEGIKVSGLMAVMPMAEEIETLRPLFRRMHALFEHLRGEAFRGVEMRHLSMGMSHDADMAAQEGATMIRLGSALFGPRG